MKRLLAIFGLIGFLISVIVHISTFFGVALNQSFPGIWSMHVCMFPLLFAMMAIVSRNNKMHRLDSQADGQQQFTSPIPRSVQIMIPIFFIYALINFALFMALAGDGTVAVQDGQYQLMNHGNVIKTLTESEYQLHKIYTLRGFSGHWMIFYLLPSIYLWFSGDQSSENGADVG